MNDRSKVAALTPADDEVTADDFAEFLTEFNASLDRLAAALQKVGEECRT